MQRTVLVMGSTGKLGEPVARRLKENGFRVRILTRDKDKAGKLFDQSFEIIVGDVLETKDLEKALDSCYGVHISVVPPMIEPPVVEKVVAMASPKGLERITYVSGTNNFEKNTWHDIPRLKLAAEKIIRNSGIPYTIFCPTAAMENLAVYIRGKRASVIGKQPHPLHWYAADDFGRMVAASYHKEEALGKRFFVHGPEGITTHEALRRYCTVFHPEIKKISTIPFWLARIIATISGNKRMKMAIMATSLYEKAGEGGDPAEANRILGAPTITLDEWLQRRKSKLSSSRGNGV